MGKVFTPEQIVNNQIPEAGAHEAAGRFVLDKFFIEDPFYALAEEEWGRTPHVWSGMVYGSTALQKASLRSDVDMLIRYHPDHETTSLKFINGVLRQAEEAFNVPIEANIHPSDPLTTPTPSTIDSLFIQHLIEIQDQDSPRWSYNWPLDGMLYRHPDQLTSAEIRTIALNYIAAKASQFAHSITEYRGNADIKVLQRALELPKSIGRKALIATTAAEGETTAMSPTGALQHRLEVYNPRYSIFGYNRDGPSQQARLINLDKEYEALLQATITNSTSIEEYKNWIEGNYQQATELAFSVTRVWQHIIGNRVDRRTNEGTFLEDGQGQLAFDIQVRDLSYDEIY